MKHTQWMRFKILICFFLCCLLPSMTAFAEGEAEAANTMAADLPTGAQVATVQKVNDPFEPFNREMFRFNYHFDRAVLKPIAELYNKIMPKPLNLGIHNFFLNINQLPIIANDVLQLRPKQTMSDVTRFAINTTIGIGGLFDVASRMQLKQQSNDFGLTLARWGYKNSAYLVLPFFGAMTIRDGIGIPVDYYGFSIYPYIRDETVRDGLYLLSVIDKRVQLLNYQTVMEEAAVDQYVFVRDAYLQRREYLLKQLAET